MDRNRRKLLLGALFGAGYAGLKGLATGLPPSFFLGERQALAAASTPPNFLVLATCGSGDPLNANCPGSYVKGVQNNPDPLMAATPFKLGTVSTSAAKPWSELPADLRARMSFFHHRTYTNAHPEYTKVMALQGAAKSTSGVGPEMLVSLFAQESSTSLGTIQQEPVALGQEQITFGGHPLDNVDTNSLKSLFAEPDDLGKNLQQLRDQQLTAIYKSLQTDGTAAEKSFLDRYSLGREQVRKLGDGLGALLTRIPTDPKVRNSPMDQAIAAAALISMKVAPVITLHLPFGGDNHGDDDLADERDQTIASVAALGQLWTELKNFGLQDQVTMATLNVFGRTLVRSPSGGRNHNQNHHVMMMAGARVKPSVIGGLVALADDFAANGIDSSTGLASDTGDVAPEASLESAGKTLGAALGFSEDLLNTRITSGKIVPAALAG
jgi:Protein of unknown function (DUF1501)